MGVDRWSFQSFAYPTPHETQAGAGGPAPVVASAAPEDDVIMVGPVGGPVTLLGRTPAPPIGDAPQTGR
jgi:hypothetical protein